MHDPAERWRRLILAACLGAFVVVLVVVAVSMGPAH